MNRHSQYRLSDLMDLKPELDRARDEYYDCLNGVEELRKDGWSEEELKDYEDELTDAREKYMELKG